MIKVQFS